MDTVHTVEALSGPVSAPLAAPLAAPSDASLVAFLDTSLGAPVEDAATAHSTIPVQRFALSRGRLRTVTPLDIVTFVSACPGCGQDAEWTEQRQDTRLIATIDCSCDA